MSIRSILLFVFVAWSFMPVARAADPARLEIVKATWTPDGKAVADVTKAIAALVKNERLDLKVDPADFGGAPVSKRQRGTLTITYKLGDVVKTASFEKGDEVWLAAITTAHARAVDRLPELRKKFPRGVVVIDAKFGVGNRWADLTDLLQSLVHEDSLTVPIGSALGDPAPGSSGKTLQIYYAAGDEVTFVEQGDGSVLQIGPRLTAIPGREGGLINVVRRAAELRKKYPTGMLVLDARFGTGNRWKDVTAELQAVVSGDALTAYVGDESLGNPAPGAAGKVLRMTYQLGEEVKSVEQPEGSTLQIGNRRTSIVGIEGGLINLDERIAERRADHPHGLLILDARFGTGRRWMDVTDRVQDVVKGRTLSTKVSTDAFGDPAPGQSDKRMVTTYFDGAKVVTVETPDGSVLKVDGKTVAGVGAGGVAMNNEERLAAFRKAYGDGLIVLDAQFGSGNRWGDVRELLQAAVVDDRLRMTVGDGWPDTAAGAVKEVNITYWDGRRIKTARQAAGSKLDLRGVKPEALRSITPLPAYAVAGRALVHQFGGKGRFSLEEGPDGALLDASGKFVWTPTPEQLGGQVVRYGVLVDGKPYFGAARVEVVAEELAKNTGGDATKLDAILRLELSEGPVRYSPGLGWKSALVLRADELIVLNADGTTVKRRSKLAKEYTQVAERKDHFVALAKEPRGLDLLDKATLKPLKTIKLPYGSLTDLAIHPTTPIIYVAVEEIAAADRARFRVVVVDEASGDVREPDNLIGRFLAIDPSGTRLYTGYKDVYRRGTRLFINPDGRLWDTPQYGNIDILFAYDLADAARPRLKAFKESAGGNGAGLRLSTDGKRLTYLSVVGYPLGSGAIPAWDPGDLEKKPVTYECKGKAGATRMDYHPTLPLVIVPTDDGALLFQRETGDAEQGRVAVPTSALDGAKIEDARFSPDGMNVIFVSRRGSAATLYKAPLKLSADEVDIVRRGVQPPAQPLQPPSNGSGRTSSKA